MILVSKRIYHTFRCAGKFCGIKFEELVSPGLTLTGCTTCGHDSYRIMSAPGFNLGGGLDPDFPTAYDKWEKRQKQKRENEKKLYDRHGVDKTYGGDIAV